MILTALNYQELLNKIKKEGDFKQFVSNGYICQIRRVNYGEYGNGHLCGYVGIPKSHKYSKHRGNRLEVHGGITYGGGEGFPDGSHKELLVFGFDCAHYGDLVVNHIESLSEIYGGVNGYLEKHKDQTYKTMEFVESELVNLSKQLKELE